MKSKQIRAIALAMLLAIFAAGCSSTNNEDSVLERGVGPEPESLDPHRARTTQSQTVLRDVFEGLLRYTADGTLAGGAAERWEISDDGLQYTFWLRPEARWSDGDVVEAGDFVYSFRRLVNPATAAFYSETLGSVVNAAEIIASEKSPESLGVEASEPFKLSITLTQPTPYFLDLLVQPATYPVKEQTVKELGDKFSRPGNLVSNGAYQLERWDRGLSITLRRNDHYWNNKDTAIDVVRHHVTPEPSAELFRYRAGELDITSTIPAEAFAQIRAEKPDELRVATFLGTHYYGLNLNYPALGQSPRLRQALSMAIDREAVTEKVIGRGEKPAYSWVPPGVANYEPCRVFYADSNKVERIATAKRLYAEAGYSEDNPLKIELRYNTSETHKNVALAIQAEWRDILGVEATLINEEFRVLVANMRAMEITQIFRSNWNGDYNDAHTFLSIFESGNASNMFGYHNDEYDDLLRRASTQTDQEMRQYLLEEAECILLADHVVIPIYYSVSKHLVSPKIKGWQDNLLDYHYSQHLSID